MHRIKHPAGRPQQALLALEPAEDELAAEVRRIWLASAYWRRLFQTEEQLLADPRRADLLRRCARQAWLARLRAGRVGRAKRT